MVPSGGRPRGDPIGDGFVLRCTDCGWESGLLVRWPRRCPYCGARKQRLVKVEYP
jgi:hypothetical protein